MILGPIAAIIIYACVLIHAFSLRPRRPDYGNAGWIEEQERPAREAQAKRDEEERMRKMYEEISRNYSQRMREMRASLVPGHIWME